MDYNNLPDAVNFVNEQCIFTVKFFAIELPG